MIQKNVINSVIDNGKYFIKEIIPVIVGILIAFYINNWNENKKDSKYINQILSSIHSDLTNSKISIEEKIPDQESLIDSLAFYSDDNKTTILNILKKVDGFQTSTIKMNSWKAISNWKIELIDYKKVSILSEIEEINEMLKMKTQYLMNFIYTNINSKEAAEKQILIILLSDIVSDEEDIKERKNEFEKLNR